MNSLSLRIGLLLGLACLLIVAALLAPSASVVLGALALAVAVAFATSWFLAHRVGQLADAVRAWRAESAVAPLYLPGADAGGDELARLSAQIEGLTLQLAGQHDLLQQAERRRSELLANVSHDLRTPLASMQGYIELLLMRHGTLAPAEERNYLQTAARQSEHLSRLVGDLFDLTRLEAGDLRPQSEDFALAELAQDVTQQFSADALRRGVTLATQCGGTPAALQVCADLALVARVLENLVENALRHTPSGGSVTIRLEPLGVRVAVTVSDSGAGIAAEDLPGIFERYDRASRVRSAGSGEHAGLGLAIARCIVGLHGADLAVRSEVGAGTQVSFDLPRAIDREKTAATRPQGLAA